MADRAACLPLAEWPSLDRELWTQAFRGDDLFEPIGPAGRWRPRTVETVREGYGHALAWLERRGLLDPCQSPDARWTRERLRGYVEEMQARLRPATVQNRLISLERALAVLVPRSDRSILRAAVRNATIRPDTARKRSRLQDPARLVALGFELMADAERGRHKNRRKNAAVYRDGLQIALLAVRPFRKRNFADLRIGAHLVRDGGAWWLILRPEETKTQQPVEVPFPDELIPALERYLGYYRGLLAGARYRGDHLWLSYLCGPESPHTLQLRLVLHTEKAFGRPVNPHLFRDCVATAIAIHDPENVRMAATVLGHRSFAVTQRHYNLARTLEAGRSYAALIGKARGSCRSSRRTA
jgi:integrase